MGESDEKGTQEGRFAMSEEQSATLLAQPGY
jgi:hypothetical protein